MKCPQVMNALRFAPWLIHGGTDALAPLGIAAMSDVPASFMNRQEESGSGRKPYHMAGGVAVIEASGMLVNFEMHPMLMEWMGLCSYASLIRAFDAAAADAQVRSVVLACDSGGGMHWGLADADAAIRRCAAVKPTVAHTASIMGSAMYWLACCTGAIYAEGQSIVGSIGTIVTMYDYSGAFKQMGVEAVAVASHENKAAGTMGLPIRDEDTLDVQELVSECSGAFVRTVATGRKMSAESVLKLATGRVWTATKAAENGLTDGVLRIGELVSRLEKKGAR